MLSFIFQTLYLLFSWCYAKIVKSLWNFGYVDTKCKNRATRNYQRVTETFGKI